MSRTFTITDARIYDDGRLSEPRSVAVVDGVIASIDAADAADAPPVADVEIVDAAGATLLPGLVDAHVHVHHADHLAALGKAGVTTAFDLGAPKLDATFALRTAGPGATTLRSAGYPASAPKGLHTTKLGMPASTAVTGPDDAARFVAERVADGSDYVKIIIDVRIPFRAKPLDARTVDAITRAAHDAGLKVIAHVTSPKAFAAAADAGVDLLTHVPVTATLDERFCASLAERGVAVSPTLGMLKALVEHWPFPVKPRGLSYEHARASVTNLHRAGVTLLAGTDANDDHGAPAKIAHGPGLADELELMVGAGLTPAEAIAAATTAPLAFFGFDDRGTVRAGLRADLVLTAGDPTAQVGAVRDVTAVWIGGVRVR
ncbi:amidohydrolase family protein [Agromyces intestinalis]|uniref:Amidohydrolase family protein n=1 Tax=Agromyces intestinalis TaxID=2592652 RepID=A0A5C1YCR0_9MICO|nr:amidohydrolase family protein [Agromyces intestinalis]QEO13884.1 amidohydrolase family protein [Agromyces intestinalis]